MFNGTRHKHAVAFGARSFVLVEFSVALSETRTAGISTGTY